MFSQLKLKKIVVGGFLISAPNQQVLFALAHASWICSIPHQGETPLTCACVVVVHMCLGLKLIRHMWEASLPDVGLNKSVRHEPKWTIPANWEPRRETIPQFFFKMVYILRTIVIMHYIFLISFGMVKIFKFQIYYSNSHSLKEIIKIIKTYHIITIDITQPKLLFFYS